MGFTVEQLGRAPWTPGNSLQKLNELIDAVNDLSQKFSRLDIPPVDTRRPAVLDIFVGKITFTPPGSSPGNPGSDYTDARYYVTRQVIPDNTKLWKYSPLGAMTDKLTSDDDPFNSSSPMPATVTATNLAEFPADGSGGTHSLAEKTLVLCAGFPRRGNPVQRAYVFIQAGDGYCFPVTVTQSGGANGTATTAASYTYDATNAITGTSITGGPFTVAWARANGIVNAATNGTGYYNSAGTFVLFQVDETPQDEACST